MDNYTELDNHKQYTFHFYRLAPAEAENALRVLFESHIQNGTNIPHAMGSDYDHHIQIQDLKSHNTPSDSFVSGIMKKYSKKDPPKIGEVGETDERPIDMTSDEALIEKTYFLYSFSHHVLLYQSNSQGTSYSRFSRYLAYERLGHASFKPLLTYETYEMLRDDNLKLKKFDVSFASPSNPRISQAQDNSGDWSDSALSFLASTGGSRMKIAVTGGLQGKNSKTLAPSAKDFLLSLIRKSNSGEGASSDLSGKIELLDEDDIKHPLDLVANRLFADVKILMEDRYPKKDAILIAMMNIMEEKADEIRDIMKNNEK